MSLTLRSLARIQFKHFLRSSFKKERLGTIIVIPYLWIVEMLIFFCLKKEQVEIPPLAIALLTAGCLLPDFLYKLLLVREDSVMDPFLKTRPVSETLWDRFLFVSQCWRVSNLNMPLILLPVCFMTLPLGWAAVLFLTLYLFSVFGGYSVMLMKHSGKYQSEKQVGHVGSHAVQSASGRYIFGIQFYSFLRSKRMLSMMILFVFLYLQCFLTVADPGGYAHLNAYMLIVFSAMFVPLKGFAIEANFFGALRTRPVAVSHLLRDKYKMGMLCGAACFLLCLPLCIWTPVSPLSLITTLLFMAGAGNLIFLYDAFNSIPFDLFGKAYGNSQGMHLKGSSFAAIVIMLMFCHLPFFLMEHSWVPDAVRALLGLTGFCCHKHFFRWMESRFEKRKYTYMAKYLTR